MKAKLEPYLGFLHSVQYGKPSLVCDLQEPYRHLMDDFVIDYSQGLKMPKEDPESRFHSLSMNLRSIEGGTESSVVPPRCKAIIEIRIPTAITVDELTQEVFNLVEGYKTENPGVMVEAKVLDSTEPYVAEKKSTLVWAFTRAIWENRKERVKLINKSGTGDMNILGRSMSIPVVTYGPGDPHLDHTPDEHIVLQDYKDAADIIVDAIRRLHELHHQVRTTGE